MFTISNDELKNLPYAADIANDITNEFEVIHTNEDKTTEVCIAKSSTDKEGNSSNWSTGFYKTKKGDTYLCVVSGKILSNIVLNK